jgi:uncharacterized damage-inducible protein DinB
VLQAVSTLSVEEFTRHLGGSFPCVRDTLVHIIGGEWGWLTIWKEPSVSSAFVTDLWTRLGALFDPNAFPDIAAVQLRWAEVEREQVEFVKRVTNESLGRMVPVRTTQISLAHLMQHLANHSTYHRGSSRANDAAACRRAGRHRLRLVFTGGTPRGSRCTLVSTKI